MKAKDLVIFFILLSFANAMSVVKKVNSLKESRQGILEEDDDYIDDFYTTERNRFTLIPTLRTPQGPVHQLFPPASMFYTPFINAGIESVNRAANVILPNFVYGREDFEQEMKIETEIMMRFFDFLEEFVGDLNLF